MFHFLICQSSVFTVLTRAKILNYFRPRLSFRFSGVFTVLPQRITVTEASKNRAAEHLLSANAISCQFLLAVLSKISSKSGFRDLPIPNSNRPCTPPVVCRLPTSYAGQCGCNGNKPQVQHSQKHVLISRGGGKLVLSKGREENHG